MPKIAKPVQRNGFVIVDNSLRDMAPRHGGGRGYSELTTALIEGNTVEVPMEVSPPDKSLRKEGYRMRSYTTDHNTRVLWAEPLDA